MVWRQERQIDLKSQEGCPQRTVTYVYEPGSYVPLARIDSAGASAEQQIGTPRHFDTEAQAANSENYGGLNNGGPGGSGQVAGSGNATGSKAQLYYFHTDTAGLPQELSDAGGALRWRASYQTRGNTLKEDWQAVGLSGAALPEHLQQQQTDSERYRKSSNKTCASKASTWTGPPGCTTTPSGTMIPTLGASSARTRLGWRVETTFTSTRRILFLGLILGGGKKGDLKPERANIPQMLLLRMDRER